MKKLISVFLILAMVLGLCACQGEEGSGVSADGLQVGYSRQSITPDFSVGLGGYSNADDRMSNGLVDYIYATCIAFSEDGETVLLVTSDLIGVSSAMVEDARNRIMAATGVPEDHIHFTATHTHEAPATEGSSSNIPKFKEFWATVVLAAAQEALADQAPATLYGGKVETEGMNFIRHYLLADGSYAGDNFGDFTQSTIVDHATEADEEMILIKAEREGEDKKDIMLMNFQAHPAMNGGSTTTSISADYIGTARAAFEQETDMLFAFFQGAGGNHNTTSRIAEEKHNLTCEEYGAKLAQYAIDAMESMEKLEGEGIKTTQVQFEYAMNHYGSDRVEDARKVVDLFNATDASTAKPLATQLGFDSVAQCRGIINCSKNGETDTMELNAVYIAGMAFITAPWEMFSNTGIYIKENSPYKYTVICSLANGRESYMPTKEAFEYGCYESWNATFGQGGAEAVAEQLVTMLKGLE